MTLIKFWQRRSIFNYLLWPFTLFWLAGSYAKKVFTLTYKSKAFVICVGNINIGGAGKTPVALFLGEKLKTLGYKVAFLSKGYKGSIQQPTLLNNHHTATQAGDEAILLNEVLPTVVAKNRQAGVKYLEKLGYTIIIMDDGYQNYSITKNYNLLIINGNYGFGNNMILPSGPLRESIKNGIKKAHSIIVLDRPDKNLLLQLKNIAYYKGNYQIENLSIYKDKKVLAFCGIGLPEKFYDILIANNITVSRFEQFPDHYKYTEEDILKLINIAQKENLQLVTTTKDYTKIKKPLNKNIIAVKIKLNLENSGQLITSIENKMKNEQKK